MIAFAAAALAAAGPAMAQVAGNYSNIIRQVQMPDGLEWDVPVSASGVRLSALAINPGGARFELHTQMTVTPFTGFLLDTKYVGSYVPIAQISVRPEAVENTWSGIPRTRADRPFFVDVTITGLLSGEDDPVPSKSVKFLRHVQSYGANGTGQNINRNQAILHTQTMIEQNGSTTLTFAINAVPGANRAKVRGEERFSIFSLEDYQAPESQLASQYIQIWPVADGSITGISQNELIRFKLPSITLAANDLYPGSSVYAQAYKGNLRNNTQLGVDAFVVPGSHKSNPSMAVPWNEVLPITNWDSIFTEDGRWTVELVTLTPFGIDRLDHVTFDLDRTIEMNGSVTTIE